MKAINEALRIIETNASLADFEGNQSLSIVHEAERLLKVKLPDSYKAFLLIYGCGDIGGFEIYGILKKDDLSSGGVPNTVATTLGCRQSYGLSSHYIIVTDAGDGAYYALDTKRMKDGECPVVLLDDVHGQKPVDVAPDFGTFLLEALQRVVGQ